MRFITAIHIIVSILFLALLSGPAGASQAKIAYEGSTLWNYTSDVIVSGQYAYFAFGYGLVIYDISNPSQLTLVSRLILPGTGRALSVMGDRVYFAAGTGGLYIIDIGDPSDPQLLGNCPIGGSTGARSVSVSGNYAYVAAYPNGLEVVDITDFENPTPISSLTSPGSAYAVAVYGTYVYIADGGGGTQVVDISDPYSPDIVTTVPVFGHTARAILIDNNRAYVVSTNGGLQILDLSVPSAPVVRGIYLVDGSLDIAVDGNTAYIGTASSGMEIVDVTDIDNPVFAANSAVMDSPHQLTIFDQYIIAIGSQNSQSQFSVLDASEPTAVTEVSSEYLCGTIKDTKIINGYAYATANGTGALDGLYIIDNSDPAHLSMVGFVEIPRAYFVYINEGFAYVSCLMEGLYIVDISDPANPFTTSHYYIDAEPGDGQVEELIVRDNVAYITLMTAGLLILDVSDKYNPAEIGFFPLYLVEDIAMLDNYVFMTPGMNIVDISDPTNPQLAGTFPTGAYFITVAGHYGFIFDKINSIPVLRVLDLTDPTAPIEIATYAHGGRQTSKADIFGNVLVSQQWDLGVQLFDISIPSAPLELGIFDTPGNAERVAITGDHIFVADYFGLSAFSYQLPDFRAGDANYDGSVNVGDAVFIIALIFQGGPAPQFSDAADANGDCSLDVGDAVTLINYVFRSGPAPQYPDCP